MLKYFQRKRERERERERENASAFRALSKRGERERTRRGIKNVSSLAKRAKEGFVLGSHVAFIHRLFGRKKKKLSFLSLFGRFDRHLSHHHRVVSIFPLLLTRARTQSRRFRKKNARERGFDTRKTSSLARNCTRARRVPFAFPSFTLKNKIKHTLTPHHRMKSRYAS